MNFSNATAVLPQIGMLVFTGPEARHFLQGQLSCDTQKLADGQWVWGGYLTAKGRLLATFIALGLADDSIGLVMEHSLIEKALAKFKMYMLRAKIQIEIDSRHWYCRPDAQNAPVEGSFRADGTGFEVGLGHNMSIGCDDKPQVEDERVLQAWLASCAQLGMPWISGPLQDELTVHMVSLDLIGGVDFDKGCYIGQEIVIRAHHRGAIKRRAFIIDGAGNPPVQGADLLSEIHGGQKVGQVLYAATVNGGYCGMASLRKDAVAGQLTLSDGRQLRAVAPPYGLVDSKFETS